MDDTIHPERIQQRIAELDRITPARYAARLALCAIGWALAALAVMVALAALLTVLTATSQGAPMPGAAPLLVAPVLRRGRAWLRSLRARLRPAARLWAPALALLALGCCGDGREAFQVEDGVRLEAAPELEEATQAAAARLLDATGVDVLTGALVVPVRLAADPSAMTAETHCAETKTAYWPDGSGVASIEVLVSPRVFDPGSRCAGVEANVLHELGHVLRSWLSAEEQKRHAGSGVFSRSAHGSSRLLDAASLTLVCEGAPCAWFEPEGGV